MKISGFSLIVTCCFFLASVLPGCSVPVGDTVNNTSAFPSALKSAKKADRYMVMHSGADIYHITSFQVARSKKQFTVHLNKVDSIHRINNDITGKPTNMLKQNAPPTQGVLHVFMKDSTSYTLDEPHTIAFDKVARIEKKD